MPIEKTIVTNKSRNENEGTRTYFSSNENGYDWRLESLAIGIGRHLETLQGQISERFEQIERNYAEQLVRLYELVDEKERELKAKLDFHETH